MIIDWRSRRYRGGSRWLSAAVLSVSVGVTMGPDISGVVAEFDVVTATYQVTGTATATWQTTGTGTATYQTTSASVAEWG